MNEPDEVERFTALAISISDGVAVDWRKMEDATTEESERFLIEELKLLAGIACVHRSGGPDGAPSGRRNGLSESTQETGEEQQKGAARAQREATKVPISWGRLEIRGRIGAGAFGEVYRAWDPRLDLEVALKLFKCPEPQSPSGVSLVEEGRLLARVRHANVVRVYGADSIGGQVGLWMDYVRGHTLEKILREQGVLGAKEATLIGLDLCGALASMHHIGLVHRDIKAKNVMREQGGRLVLMDFGSARSLPVEEETPHEILGTPLYMAPEVFRGEEATARSDLYSLGVLLYHLVTGNYPVVGSTVGELRRAHELGHRHLLRDERPDLPDSFVGVVERCLAARPEGRFASAGEMEQALALVLGSARSERSPVPANRPPEEGAPNLPASLFQKEIGPAVAPARRRIRKWALGAALILTAILLGVPRVTRWIGGALLGLRPGLQAPAPIRPTRELSEIAVLPFQNLSAEGPDAYFAGGLHDELLTQLAQVATLKVISRTSVMGYQGTSKPLKAIAAELGVGSVVEGSVQVVGGRLRVNVQLIDAATDEYLWAERYDRTLDDAFAIQTDVAQRIVAAVGMALTSLEQGRIATAPTANAEAYRLYLQGRDYGNRPGYRQQDGQSTQKLYEQALTLDPNFALAHAALSEVHGKMYWFRYDPSAARLTRQRDEAQAALRITPDLPQAHIAMGLAHYFGRRDYRLALHEFAIALKGLPNDANLYAYIGFAHRRLGDWNDALAALEKAIQLNPRDANLFFDLGGGSYQVVRRYADAVRAYDQALSLAPDLQEAAIGRGWTFVSWQGRLDPLRTALSRLPREAELGPLGDADAHRAKLLLWERNADGLLLLAQTARGHDFVGMAFFLPGVLYAAWAHQLRGDGAAARAAFDSARVRLDSALSDLPDDWRVHAARGLALAGLGRRDEALQEALWLRQSAVYRTDAYDGPRLAADRARILAQAGDVGGALSEIDLLLARPSEVSVHTLRLDPLWDPIRDDPRFKALLVKYAPGAPQ